MNASIIRKLALAHPATDLEAATNALGQDEHPKIQVDGTDDAERLSHATLALRIRRRMDLGIDAKTAFRTTLSDVRQLLTHD
ncbi:MAG: hypothetical protein AB8H79_15485 [Myxococcota bacterium]